MVTMKDVAKAAGVSQAAVSYAYSRPEKLSVEQREYILAVATDLGYPGPHIAGQTLKGGRIGAVGVMVTGSLSYALSDPSALMVLRGIAEVGEFSEMPLTIVPLQQAQRGHKIDVASFQGAPIPITSPVLRGLVDGLVVYALPDENPIVFEIVKRGLPSVTIDSPIVDGVPHVTINDRSAACAIFSHLLDLGHREITIVADRVTRQDRLGVVPRARIFDTPYRVTRERLLGYKDAAQHHGVDFRNFLIVEAGGFHRAAADAAVSLALKMSKPTAIVAMDDLTAVAALDVLQSMGIAVPKQMSVVGFDDNATAEPRQLTTIRQPMVEKGRAAASLLMDLLKGLRPESVVLPTELVLRSSTGLPIKR